MSKPRLFAFLLVLLMTALTVVFVVHAYLGSYTRFIADDYCSAYLGQRFGLLRYLWFWYLNWGGRFSAIAADMVLAWSRPQGIGWVPGVALAIWTVLLTAAVFHLLPGEVRRSRALIALTSAEILVFVTLLLMPNVPQSLYWYSAFRTHLLPVIVFSGYLAVYAVFRTRAWPAQTGLAWLGGSFLLAWFAAGFSEAWTAVQFSLLTLAAFLEWTWGGSERARSRVGFLLTGLAGTALALLILLAAPGNLNRQESFYRPSGWGEMFQISFHGYISLLQSALAAPARIVGLIGALLFFFSLGALHPAPQPVARRRLLLVLALTVLLPAVSFLPAAYGIGDVLPERAHDIPIFVLLSGAFVIAFLAGAWVAQPRPALGMAALAGILLFSSTAMLLPALLESRHVFIAYAERMDRVEQEILQARQSGRQVIHIPKLGNWAGTFDPTDNPRFFSTACISLYYDIQVLGPDPFQP